MWVPAACVRWSCTRASCAARARSTWHGRGCAWEVRLQRGPPGRRSLAWIGKGTEDLPERRNRRPGDRARARGSEEAAMAHENPSERKHTNVAHAQPAARPDAARPEVPVARDANRDRAIDLAISSIEKQYGKGAI